MKKYLEEVSVLKLACIQAVLALLRKKGKSVKGTKMIIFNALDEDVPKIMFYEQHGGVDMGFTGSVTRIEAVSGNDAGVVVQTESGLEHVLLSELCAEDVAEIHDYIASFLANDLTELLK